MLRKIFAYLSVFIMSATLASCGPPPQLGVNDSVINLSPVEGRPGSGYFTVTGGRNDVYLQAVTSDYIQRIEMHETTQKDGMMSMQPIENILIPAGEKVKFESGGKHLMVYGVNPVVVRKGTVELEFIFSDGTRYLIPTKIQALGGGDMPGMDMGDSKKMENGGDKEMDMKMDAEAE